MLKSIFTIGLLALLGLLALKLVFGLVGFAFGLLGLVLKLAIPVAIFAGVGYVVLKIVSPDTAKKIRDGASGSSL